MRIVEERKFQGANCFLPVPAIVLTIELDSATGPHIPSRLGEVARRLNGAIKSIDNAFARARVDEEYPQEPPSHAAGELVASLSLALQRQLLCFVSQARVLVHPRSGQVLVAYEARHARFGLLAGRQACSLFSLALTPALQDPDPLPHLVKEFKKSAEPLIPNMETLLLLQEAERRGIPWFRLGETIPVVQLGHGARRRRFRNSLTDETGDTAYRLASFKPLASHLLHAHGVPVPMQAVAGSEAQAASIANRIGFPVVIKPVNQDMGVGVQVAIASELKLKEAYSTSRAYGQIQVERDLPGFDHRITFIRGRLVSVLRTTPPIIVGDGMSSIRQLLELEPKKTATLAQSKIIVDDEVLACISEAGHEQDDVLPEGKVIVLRRWWRNQKDHVLEDVTTLAHPDNIDMALLAVQLLGLDVAGVDFITSDISRPYHETGGAITEVNPMPAMAGVQRCGAPAYQILLDAFFPDGATGRIATAVVLGTRNDDATVAVLEALLERTGYVVGVATRSRLQVAGRPIRRAGLGENDRAGLVLHHPRPTAAILQATAEVIAAEGTVIDQCEVGAIFLPEEPTQASAADADEPGIQAAVLLCRLAARSVVVDADDPRAVPIIAAAADRRVLWVEAALGGSAGAGHRRAGDALIALERLGDEWFIAIDDGAAVHRIAPACGQLLGNGATDLEFRRAWLTAVAVAFGMGLPPASISEAAAAHLGSPSQMQAAFRTRSDGP